MSARFSVALLLPILSLAAACSDVASVPTAPADGERIVIVGNGLGQRMLDYPYLETELHRRFPGAGVVVRNMSRSGSTAGFRPHPARNTQWAFAGAEAFHPDKQSHTGEGHYPYPDEWLTSLETDTLLAMFGYNESFAGDAGLKLFEAEMDAFVVHTLAQRYNGVAAPRLVLLSPIAFEDLSKERELPDGEVENRNLANYSAAMERVAARHGIEFVDLCSVSRRAMTTSDDAFTINGFAPTDTGYRVIAEAIANALYADSEILSPADADTIFSAVSDKNWHWRQDYDVLNGVHVYGRRHEPYGDDNYPEEIEKIRQMTALRDSHVHALARGEDSRIEESSTRQLTPVETNFDQPIEFLDVDRALAGFKLPNGFKVDLFASESEFAELRNPVQMSFDDKGRLWVAVWPSYPHFKPGDPLPDDKLLIFEDADGDGRADKRTVFADGLHAPIGFELAPEGVYVSQQPGLVLLTDEDGDDRADRREVLLLGFDSHDTHHAISAFTADAAGGIYMTEGIFLHSQVETPYGPRRSHEGGIWRFDPATWRLERHSAVRYTNPWGIAFDEWGQMFLADASNGRNWWILPLSAKMPYGEWIERRKPFTTHRVRPTSGAEFVSSQNFPDEFQGDYLSNNVIGFLGIKQHTVEADGAGYTGELRQELLSSTDPNFRPVDLEFAPDNSLYLIDWHNPLIGHMQHSARDPNRDNDHGRIYRIWNSERPLTKAAHIDGADVDELLMNLEMDDYRSRYRSRRALRGHERDQVLPALDAWVRQLDNDDPDYERHLLEALWVSWSQRQTDRKLLQRCLKADAFQVRAAAIEVLRYDSDGSDADMALYLASANDEHPQVRLAAVMSASWLDDSAQAATVFAEAMKHPVTPWLGRAFAAASSQLEAELRILSQDASVDAQLRETLRAHLDGDLNYFEPPREHSPDEALASLTPEQRKLFDAGRELYARDGYCGTCHGEDGNGASAGIFPPLHKSEWVYGDDERLIKIVLKGLSGPIVVNGRTYDPSNGVPPMTPFGGLMSDDEIAAVLTYIRYQFATDTYEGRVIAAEQVAAVREAVADKQGFFTVEELGRSHDLPRL